MMLGRWWGMTERQYSRRDRAVAASGGGRLRRRAFVRITKRRIDGRIGSGVVGVGIVYCLSRGGRVN